MNRSVISYCEIYRIYRNGETYLTTLTEFSCSPCRKYQQLFAVNKQDKNSSRYNTLLPSKESNEKSIEAKVKSIISTVMQRCKKESSCNALVVPLEDYEQRASYYTAFPKSYFWELQDEEKRLKVEGNNFTIPQRIFILQCIRDFYVNRKQLTYEKFYKAIKQFENMPDFVYFMRELSLIGYEYRYTKNGFVLIEDPIRRFERFNFLKKIRNIRNNNSQLYYIDVRIIDKTYTFEKFTGTNDAMRNLVNFLFVHVISRNGYENGLFTNVLTEEDFVKWVSDVLFTSLTPGATIVIDNNPFFAHEGDMHITKYDSKNNMLKWLKYNNIPCNLNMHKAELYELIIKSQVNTKKFKLDEIFRAHGFEVLRLPHKLDELTPTDLMWKHIKTAVKPHVVPDMDLITIKNLVKHTIDQINSSKWTHFSVVIDTWEKEIFEIDETIEFVFDNTFEIITKDIVENVQVPEYFYSVPCRCEILDAAK